MNISTTSLPNSGTTNFVDLDFDNFVDYTPTSNSLKNIAKKIVDATNSLKNASIHMYELKNAVKGHTMLFYPGHASDKFLDCEESLQSLAEFAHSLNAKSQAITSIFDQFFLDTRKADSKAKLSIVQQSVKSYKTATKNMNQQLNKVNKQQSKKHPQVLAEYISESESLFELQRFEIATKIQSFKDHEISIWNQRLLSLLKMFNETDEKFVEKLPMQVNDVVLPSKSISKTDVDNLATKIDNINQRKSFTVSFLRKKSSAIEQFRKKPSQVYGFSDGCIGQDTLNRTRSQLKPIERQSQTIGKARSISQHSSSISAASSQKPSLKNLTTHGEQQNQMIELKASSRDNSSSHNSSPNQIIESPKDEIPLLSNQIVDNDTIIPIEAPVSVENSPNFLSSPVLSTGVSSNGKDDSISGEKFHESIATHSFKNDQENNLDSLNAENIADGITSNNNSLIIEIKKGDSVKFYPKTESRGWVWGQVGENQTSGWFPKYCVDEDE